MRAFRLCQAKWATTAFSGLGAAEFPGRWNLPGEKAVYCAESRSLGALESLAHVTRKRTLAKASFLVFAVEVPDALIADVERLPRGWDATPCSLASQKFGSKMLKNHAVLKVPSVVTRGEFNLVLNPDHPAFTQITWSAPEPLRFDVRTL